MFGRVRVGRASTRDRGDRSRVREGVVIGDMPDEIDRQLAPSDEFVEVGIARGWCGSALLDGLFDGERDGERADVAEVEVRREAAGSVGFGVVALLWVIRKMMIDEMVQPLESGAGSSGEGVNRFYRTIKALPA